MRSPSKIGQIEDLQQLLARGGSDSWRMKEGFCQCGCNFSAIQHSACENSHNGHQCTKSPQLKKDHFASVLSEVAVLDTSGPFTASIDFEGTQKLLRANRFFFW